tara:strand:- start:153 stop:1106 length:954 start_codon:yes stop_codon:yes gene_type:complete
MNKFKWKKLGLITDKLPENNWSKSHMQFPAVLILDDVIRVFVSTRPNPESDGKNVTLIRSFDLDKNSLFTVTNYSSDPIIPLGNKGEFDQFGTMPGDFIIHDNKIKMFYTGWNRLSDVPYNFSIGLAISEDKGKTFNKFSNGPIIGQSVDNPYTCGSGAALIKDNKFHMFCISGIDWILVNGKLEHTYGIKHAYSDNGISWKFYNEFAIYPKNNFEAIAAPTVIKIKDKYHMWFSYRGSHDFRGGTDSYKIGYASSEDLIKWKRDDENSGIKFSKNGWDSNMMCYPYVFNLKNEYYMLYNGNSFGKNSIGLAKMIFE